VLYLFPASLLHPLFFHSPSLHLAICFLVSLSIMLFPNSYIILFWEFCFLPFSVHAQTSVICVALLCLLSWFIVALLHAVLNPLSPELNPSTQHCLMRFFTGDFASWTMHFVNTVYAWKTNKYTNCSFSLLIMYGSPTCFSITLPSSGSVPSAFWEMLNWGAVDRILWMGVLCLLTWCTYAQYSIDCFSIEHLSWRH
jgi:hypothetical protein